ncbi:hypothetical protein EYC58_03415 [Candidatus Saccharibacteria bacterium]|nr:MAG: hypothetical protein EYC58_03415 [Candidatus Saccharibacteria bacterium]
MTLVHENLPASAQEMPTQGASGEPLQEAKNWHEKEHARALQVDMLLSDGVVPDRISTAIRVRILDKVIDNDERFSKTIKDERKFDEKRLVAGYYEQKARLCLRAIAKARKARHTSGIL